MRQLNSLYPRRNGKRYGLFLLMIIFVSLLIACDKTLPIKVKDGSLEAASSTGVTVTQSPGITSIGLESYSNGMAATIAASNPNLPERKQIYKAYYEIMRNLDKRIRYYCGEDKFDLYEDNTGALYDINHDGIEELLLMYCLDGQDCSYEIWSYEGASAVLLDTEVFGAISEDTKSFIGEVKMGGVPYLCVYEKHTNDREDSYTLYQLYSVSNYNLKLTHTLEAYQAYDTDKKAFNELSSTYHFDQKAFDKADYNIYTNELEVTKNIMVSYNYNGYEANLSFRQLTDALLNEFDSIIVWKDSGFEQSIRNLLKKPLGNIYESETQEISQLFLDANDIHAIDDLIHFPNLEQLELTNNQIEDISVLANLKKLTYINLSSNEVFDVSPLTNLNALTSLDLNDNQIVNITGLKLLTKLDLLNLASNYIKDISPLANMSELTYLNLGYNNIGDISALANLTSLQIIYLNDNHITDISAFRNLKHLLQIDLSGNSIADWSPIQG
ncbi:MAG TPA: leucine-rich repeat domain-containing protein [Mobilitalea sp.]|nr:leucine-rich repeat domain-containing protein [Mobilitalea sp.]